jgi:hypothetical protein
VDGTTQTPSYTISVYQQTRTGSKSFNGYSSAQSGRLEARNSDYSTNPRVDFYISCDMTGKLALQMNADQARAAQNLGTAAGVTTFDGLDAVGRIEGGNAFWLNNNSSPEYSNVRFNLSTGALASSTSTTGTYSPISLALPSTSTEYGAYGESLSRNNSFFTYKEAKTICLSYNNQTTGKGFDLSATAYGNMFYPDGGRRDMMGLTSLEAPMGGFGRSCNDIGDR